MPRTQKQVVVTSPYFRPSGSRATSVATVVSGTVTRNTHRQPSLRGRALRIPGRPSNYEALVSSLEDSISIDEFGEFLERLVGSGVMVAENARRCLKGAAPFIEGSPVSLSNGATMPEDCRVTLMSDLYQKQNQVRAFEKANNDPSKGWVSHSASSSGLGAQYPL